MTEEEKQHEIWTPPEKLDPNVQRMAWLLFIEEWKRDSRQSDNDLDAISVEGVCAWTEDNYKRCLAAAKAVRRCEVEAGSA